MGKRENPRQVSKGAATLCSAKQSISITVLPSLGKKWNPFRRKRIQRANSHLPPIQACGASLWLKNPKRYGMLAQLGCLLYYYLCGILWVVRKWLGKCNCMRALEARDDIGCLSLPLGTSLFETGSPLDLGLTVSFRLAGRQDLGCAQLCPQCWGYEHWPPHLASHLRAGIQTQELTLVNKELCPLSPSQLLILEYMHNAQMMLNLDHLPVFINP